MKYSVLGNTDIKVSKVCLGTMTWGEQNSEAEGHQQMDLAVEKGINFFDTAELYPVPPRPATQGRTEDIIGTWFKKSGKRDKIILATKAVGKDEDLNYFRDNKQPATFDKKNLEFALNRSLKRLQTDYIDVYQLHWPDRETNYFGQLGYTHNQDDNFIPLRETLEILQGFIKQGKIRHIGLSNETPWGVLDALRNHEQHGSPRVVSVQNPYNLLNRSYEVGMAEISVREQVGLLAYSPLGMGVLSGKYLNGAKPAGARLTIFNRFQRYNNTKANKATEQYVRIAKEAGVTPTQLALAFINQQAFVTSNIIGATSLEQLEENISSIDITLSKETLRAIDIVHNDIPNPCP